MLVRLGIWLILTLGLAASARAAPPAITGFTPQTGTIGTLVKIVGVGLDSTVAVRFNGTLAESIRIISSTHIKAVVPRRATSGPITISGPSGEFESEIPFLVEPAGGIRLAFARPRPNPSRGAVAWRFSLGRPGSVCLAIFNVRGNRVRTICRDYALPGVQELRWDGRDASGSRLPAGVYCGSLDAEGARVAQCVTLVR